MAPHKTILTSIMRTVCHVLAVTAVMAAIAACGGDEPSDLYGEQPAEGGTTVQSPIPTLVLPPTQPPLETPEPQTPEPPGPQTTPQPGRAEPRLPTPTPPAAEDGTIVELAVGYAQHVPGRRHPVLKATAGQVLKLRAYARYDDGTYGPIPKDPLRIPTFSVPENPRLRLHPGNTLEVLAPVRARITLSWDTMVHTFEVQADPEPNQTADQLTGVTVRPTVINLTAPGETRTLRTGGLFEDGSTGPLPLFPGAGITFSSSEPDVAEVSYDGTLTASSTGATEIRVHFGPHITETPAHATVLIPREDPRPQDTACLYPHPDQEGMSISANRLKVTLYPEHNTEQTAAAVADRLRGTPIGQDRARTLHVIEFACPNVPQEGLQDTLNELALLLMEQTEVEFIEHLILRTPTSTSTPSPSEPPADQAPTAPNSAGDLTVRMEIDPQHIRLQPGEHWQLRKIILHQNNRSTERLPLDSIGLTFDIAPIGDDHPELPYLQLVRVDETGAISAGRTAPTSSVIMRAHYLGHTANLQVDIRAGDGPGSMNALDCAKRNSTGALMIEFRPGTNDQDRDQLTDDLGAATVYDYPAFNGRTVTIACDSPMDMTQAVAKALEHRAVAYAYPYIPTPGDAAQELWQPALPAEQKRIILEMNETRLIEPMGRRTNGTVQPLTEEERDCVFFDDDAGDPGVASVDTMTGAVTSHEPGYASVTVDSCGSGPPLTVHIYVDSYIEEEPETGPVLHELRIETQEGPVLLRPGDSEPISIWAVYQNGQEVLLQPGEDQVEFTTARVQVHQDETGWSLAYPNDQQTEDAFNERITVTHQGATTQRTVLLRPGIDPAPIVDEQCRYPAFGTTTLVTANTVAVHMDRRTRTEREGNRTARALGAEVIGRSTHQDWKERSQYLLAFVCETDGDLHAFHQRATNHEGVLNLRHHPESPGGSRIWELDAGPDVTLEQGTSHNLEVRAHLFDGTIRPVPEDEKSKVKATSHDDTIITAGEGHQVHAHRTGRTSVEIQYEDLLDWATVTVLPAQIDDQCVARTVLVTDGQRTIVQAQDLTEIRFTLQKDHGLPAASQLAAGLGRTISEEASGLDAAPAWRAHREMECRNGTAPEQPGIRELQAQVSGLRADPRVRDASFTTSHTTLELTQGTGPETPADFGWDAEPPAGRELQGLVVQIIGADRIYPSNRLRFLVGGDYGDDLTAPLSPDIAESFTVTSLTETTLLVGAGDLITALRPGDGRLRFEVSGHRKTVGITVQEDLIKGPELGTGCVTDVGGIMVAHDQAAVTMEDGSGTEEAKAVATDSGGVVIWTNPDGRTHLLERACLSFEEGVAWAELLASRYDSVADAHLHVP